MITVLGIRNQAFRPLAGVFRLRRAKMENVSRRFAMRAAAAGRRRLVLPFSAVHDYAASVDHDADELEKK